MKTDPTERLKGPGSHQPWREPAPRRQAPWALVLLLHAGLIWQLEDAVQIAPRNHAARPDEPSNPTELSLLWLRTEAAVLPPTPSQPLQPTGKKPPAQLATPQTSELRVLPNAAATAGASPAAVDTTAAITAPLGPEPPASAPPIRLMDTAATRQALREASRNPLLSERAQAVTGIQNPTQAERLSAATAAAGHGDCAKGEFAGGGMGLLSLPFLAAAAISGQCGR